MEERNFVVTYPGGRQRKRERERKEEVKREGEKGIRGEKERKGRMRGPQTKQPGQDTAVLT